MALDVQVPLMGMLPSAIAALDACRQDADVAKRGLRFLAGLGETAGNQVRTSFVFGETTCSWVVSIWVVWLA